MLCQQSHLSLCLLGVFCPKSINLSTNTLFCICVFWGSYVPSPLGLLITIFFVFMSSKGLMSYVINPSYLLSLCFQCHCVFSASILIMSSVIVSSMLMFLMCLSCVFVFLVLMFSLCLSPVFMFVILIFSMCLCLQSISM